MNELLVMINIHVKYADNATKILSPYFMIKMGIKVCYISRETEKKKNLIRKNTRELIKKNSTVRL